MYKLFILCLFILTLSCSDTVDDLIQKGNYSEAAHILSIRIDKSHKKEDYIKLLNIYNEYIHEFDKGIKLGNDYYKYFNTYKDIEQIMAILCYNNAKVFFEKFIYDSTLFYINRALGFNPIYEKCYILRAITYFTIKENEKAKQSLNELKNIDPNNKQIYLISGNIYLKEESYEKAFNEYQKALSIDSMFPEAWANLGVLYYITDNTAYAISAFRKAIEFDSLNIISYDYLIKMFSDANMQDSSYRYMQLYENNKERFSGELNDNSYR